MIFFCPKCYSEVKLDSKICQKCNFDISRFNLMDYEEKLEMALFHKEPETVLRAIRILADRNSRRALDKIVHLLEISDNPYIIAELSRAILKFNDVNYYQILKNILKIKNNIFTKDILKKL